MIDFKAAIERKFNEFHSDLPARLAREIRAFESREQQLSKDIADKLAQFQEQHIRSRDNLKQGHGQLSDQAQSFELKLN